MTNEEVYALYPANTISMNTLKVEDYSTPQDFEHRVDPHSSLAIYSFLREYKPVNCLQIGCWEGGTTGIIMAALKKNGKPFRFVASELLADKMIHTAEHTIREYGIKPEMVGDITTSLPDDLKDIDFLFHDTDHDLETTDWVVKNVFPRLKEGALVIFHDWAVMEKDGKWIAKDGEWGETRYLIDMHENNSLPMEKVYWNYGNPDRWETGVFLVNRKITDMRRKK